MCSVPVTLGGGSWMQNDGRAGSSVGAKAPLASQTGAQRASMAAGSKDLASSDMERCDKARRFDTPGRVNGQGAGRVSIVGGALFGAAAFQGDNMQKTTITTTAARWRLRASAALLPLLLAACGGGSDDDTVVWPSAPLSCSIADQKRWLGNTFMDDWLLLEPAVAATRPQCLRHGRRLLLRAALHRHRQPLPRRHLELHAAHRGVRTLLRRRPDAGLRRLGLGRGSRRRPEPSAVRALRRAAVERRRQGLPRRPRAVGQRHPRRPT